MENTKPFKTHDDLIELLESRGIDFSRQGSKSFAKKQLQRIGYYGLINGYSPLFIDKTTENNYLPGTTIEEIYNLFLFDRKLRQILLSYILPLETNVKSLVAYYFPIQHPESNYLVYNNFDTSRRDSSRKIMDLISEIQRQVAGRVSDPSISHYLKKYGYIPIWVLNNILTLGTISKFYSLMQQQERQDIARTFHLKDNELENLLFYISNVRNFCAHGNRLYCYRSKRPLCDTSFHETAGIEKNIGNEYAYGKRDLFAVMIALKLTVSKKDYRQLVKAVDIALKNLDQRLNTISLEKVLSSMGFPIDWKTKLLLPLK